MPVALVAALILRRARELRLLGVPQLGLAAELLVGAGCVRSVEAAAVSLGEWGTAPLFERARREGRIEVVESSCPAVHAGLTAAERGVPFMPVRGLLGSDLLRLRPDWKVIANPFPPEDPLVLVPAIVPDVALLHARAADRQGNLWLGMRKELVTLAHAARRTLATVEEVVEGDLLADEERAAGTLPALYVEAVGVACGGCWPLGLAGRYGPDPDWLSAYREAAATPEGFRRMLEAFLERMA